MPNPQEEREQDDNEEIKVLPQSGSHLGINTIGGDDSDQASRYRLLHILNELGVNTASLDSLTIAQLSDLITGFNKITNSHNQRVEKELKYKGRTNFLSREDKKILKAMLASDGNISLLRLSNEVGIPITTMQRRRKRLAHFFGTSYYLMLEEFGLRSVTFFITTENGTILKTAKEILTWQGVTSVSRIFSSNGTDMKAEVVLKTNKEIMDFAERLRMLQGVKELFWSEPLDTIGINKETYNLAIDSIRSYSRIFQPSLKLTSRNMLRCSP
jgi:DNA-binding Lrp family transcriptional regulator